MIEAEELQAMLVPNYNFWRNIIELTHLKTESLFSFTAVGFSCRGILSLKIVSLIPSSSPNVDFGASTLLSP